MEQNTGQKTGFRSFGGYLVKYASKNDKIHKKFNFKVQIIQK